MMSVLVSVQLGSEYAIGSGLPAPGFALVIPMATAPTARKPETSAATVTVNTVLRSVCIVLPLE
ncbi:hypothetical protein C5C53_15540 [Rathayibacter sp. AY1E3]|nr:hypothetical protein C5C30_16625 [Rathayibacter sp. AY2B5]PPH00827.1 hypothetical protein C5C33_17010 [Rathayibacter sp. AY1H3]PPH34471.1 hypothetical protein C5C53_15540 [Rathayibacter sp. AY1E3]PPH68495.1 hypothetical protein C5C90_17010 [Rathayibacter sp. AY1D4]PPH84169.1 hypothetical protein C5C64_17270 [Rathayibacter sp. AY1D3]